MIIPWSHRKHFKGTEYTIITLAKHSETTEDMVVYQDLSYPEKIWVRPLSMFLEKVIVHGEEIERFSLVT